MSMSKQETQDAIKRDHFLDALQLLTNDPVPRSGLNMKCVRHDDSTPSMTVYYDAENAGRPHAHCWVCHEQNDPGWDALDLTAQYLRIDDGQGNAGDRLDEVTKQAAELFRLDYQPNQPSDYHGNKGTTMRPPRQAQPQPVAAKLTQTQRIAITEEQAARRKRVLETAQENTDHPVLAEYLQSRGISMETAQRFGIGYMSHYYVNEDKPQNRPFFHQAVIIPTPNSIIARNPDAVPGDKTTTKVWKQKPVEPFNVAAIYQGEIVHFVEGELDALSVEQVGGHAISLPNKGGTEATIQAIMAELENPTEAIRARHLIVSTDNDFDGKAAAQKLMVALQSEEFQQAFERATGVKPHVAQIDISNGNGHTGLKDPNELLLIDPATLRENIQKIADAEKERDYRNQNSMVMRSADLYNRLRTGQRPVAIKTGFDLLDDVLGGGLYPGFCLLAGDTGMGKTAFALQVAEQIAKGGHDVLYISMEMSHDEVEARSISRITYEIGEEREPGRLNGTDTQLDTCKKTMRQIYGDSWDKYTGYEMAVIREAFQRYAQYADRLFIKEGGGFINGTDGEMNVDAIRELVKEHRSMTGHSPVVIVDYLQILPAPLEYSGTERQSIDYSLKRLKALSKDYQTPVVGLSSINRDARDTDATLSALKESGLLEFTCDVALFIQLRGMADDDGAKSANGRGAARKTPEWMDSRLERFTRPMEIKVAKNRNGQRNKRIAYDYVATYQQFTETGMVRNADSGSVQNGSPSATYQQPQPVYKRTTI